MEVKFLKNNSILNPQFLATQDCLWESKGEFLQMLYPLEFRSAFHTLYTTCGLAFALLHFIYCLFN